MSDPTYIKWPKADIEALLADALANGVARVQLDTAEDARNFRWALYNFRRTVDDRSYDKLVFSVEETVVTVAAMKTPALRRLA